MARHAPTRLTLGEWAVLGALVGGPRHAFAIVKALAAVGELGRVWSVPTPVVYRAVNTLREQGLIATVGEQRSASGPPRTLLAMTPAGKRHLQDWSQMPVAHMRDVRGELLLKLAVLARRDESPRALVRAQLATFEPLVRGLERQAEDAEGTDFEATLARWRLESARAVMRFLSGLADAS